MSATRASALGGSEIHASCNRSGVAYKSSGQPSNSALSRRRPITAGRSASTAWRITNRMRALAGTPVVTREANPPAARPRTSWRSVGPAPPGLEGLQVLDEVRALGIREVVPVRVAAVALAPPGRVVDVPPLEVG